ncbi:UNVERIFIED_CONTAM: hypothetical protein K2H54_057265 [Gekko kuhli]
MFPFVEPDFLRTVDVDECVLQEQLCANGQCRNIAGSYRCLCGQGYQLSTTKDYCEDINECQEDHNICRGGNCINTKGSYECTCPSGFHPVPSRGCQDINECAGTNLCLPHGECLNTEGSFHCVCEQGFTVSVDGQMCEEPWHHYLLVNRLEGRGLIGKNQEEQNMKNKAKEKNGVVSFQTIKP